MFCYGEQSNYCKWCISSGRVERFLNHEMWRNVKLCMSAFIKAVWYFWRHENSEKQRKCCPQQNGLEKEGFYFDLHLIQVFSIMDSCGSPYEAKFRLFCPEMNKIHFLHDFILKNSVIFSRKVDL